MARLVFILDTNVISDLIEEQPVVMGNLQEQQMGTLCLCAPVDYEIQRGLSYVNSTRKRLIYEQRIRPQFNWVSVVDEDWITASRYWVSARKQGKQLSEIDLLIAAIAKRLNAIIVSHDSDFDILDVRRNTWR